MLEALENAKGEIKRSDHLIYVSLKYTRTVDVLKSIIKRLINAFDYSLDCLLKFAQDQKQIKDLPKLPIAKVETVRSIFNDPQLNELLDFYILLRKLDKADYESSQEYRRHVTMTAFVDGSKRPRYSIIDASFWTYILASSGDPISGSVTISSRGIPARL